MQQARDSLADIVDSVRWASQTVRITRYDKTVAYLVGPKWYEEAAAALAREKAAG